MHDRLLLITALLALMLSGCTPDQNDEPDPAEAETHLLESQQQALERARAVEDQLQEAADQRLEALDEQENDG